MRPAYAVILVLMLLASASLVLISQPTADPLAPYRAADGSLRIPGSAFTPQLQHLLFGGTDLQPTLNLTSYVLVRSPYSTAELVPRGYLSPNPNVFVHSSSKPKTLTDGFARLAAKWFPPVDWGGALNQAISWFFGLFTWDARAAVTVDSTTVTDIGAAANTCTTSQTTGASDNAVLVLLSERGTTTFQSVTYGTVTLSLVAGTGANGGILVRTEVWAFVGTLPAGSSTMTATLSGGGTARMTCATVLLQGVKAVGSFINGTSNAANSTNANVTFTATIGVGDLGFAVAALQNAGGGAQPTAVAGTGATATDLYGVGTVHCSGSGAANECAAGASIPNPGTAVTWTNPSTQWVVSAVEAVAIPTCGTVGSGNCYRIGNNGTWTSTANWSNTPGGASCGCAPLSTDFAFFNATPTGTTTLSAATTIAGVDMTGFTGTLDTSNANNWALTVNGNFTIQGTFQPRGSVITISGNITVLGATTVVAMSSSTWTVNGTWTNNSTSATWSAGTSTVTIKDAASGTLTFAALSGATNEFNNLTLDASVAAGVTYTMATNGLRMGGTLLIQNSTAGATGSTLLDTSASNLAVTTGALSVAIWGAFDSQASAITVNGNANVSAATAYVTNTAGSWVVTGTWTDTSTSTSWAFAASITFRAGGARTMTFGPQAGTEFAGAVTFDATATAGLTYTMAGTNPLDVGGLVTIQNSAGGATGPVILDTSAGSLAITAGGLTQSTFGALNSRASAITVNGDVNVSAANAYVTNAGGAWTVSGAWTNRTTSASWSFAAALTFRAGASKTMTFTGSNIAGNEFGGAVTFDTTATAGVTYTMGAGATGDASLKVGGSLTARNTAAGATAAVILDTSTSNYSITAASLTLGNPRGGLRSEGSTITINGAVNVSDANSYMVLGSASWTVAGSWTNNSTDGVDWSAGTGTIAFRAAANATMTFANLGANEANNLVFDTSNAAGITYTMSTNALRIAGSLTVQNTAATPTGNTILTTGGTSLAITSGGVVLGSRGTLTANASTITVNGSWTSTAANHAWNKGTSTVVFGASGTLTMSGGESLNILTQSAGTTTLGSNVTVSGATTVNGTLDTSASNLTLTLQSTLAIGASGVLNLEASTASTSGNVTIAAGGAVRFTGSATWTINGAWTNNNTAVPASWAVATSTVRIVGGAAATLTFWTAAGNEFNNLTLDASVVAGFTYTQVNALQAGGTLTVQNTAGGATGPVILDASASNYASTLGGLSLGSLGAYAARGASVTVNGNVTVAASGYMTSTGAGAWAVTGSWSNATTSGSWSFAAPITFRSATGQTMTFKASGTEFGGAVSFDTTAVAGVTYTMATNGLTLSGLLTVRNSVVSPTGNTVLDTSGSGLGISAGSVTLGTNGTLRANGSTVSVGGNWAATSVNATFTAMTSTVVFTAAASINMTQAFNNLTVSAGTSTLASNLTANATVTLSGGLLAKATFTLSTGALTLTGGSLTSTSGAATVTGNVTVSAAASYIAFGSETWTIGGSWANSSTSATWSAGTGTVVFSEGSSATMTFAGTNLSGNEFNNVIFDTPTASGVTYTMASRGLRVAGAVTVRNSTATPTGNTVLDTSASGLALTAASLTLGVNGTLTANGSVITLSGNWSSTAASATLNAATSTVVMTAAATIALGSSQAFNVLTIAAGTVTLGSPLTAAAVNVNGGTLAKGGNPMTVNGDLALGGGALTSTSGAVTVTGAVSLSAAASYIVFGSETWTISGTWTNASTNASWSAGTGTVVFSPSASGTYTFGNLPVSEFNNITFSPIAAATVTMATNGLRWAGALTINGNATLATSSLSLTGGSLTVGSGGALTANGSAVSVSNVSMTGGAMTMTTGSWTVSGNWDTSGAGSMLTPGTSTVTLNGASKTVNLGAGQQFATLVVSGAASMLSDLAATNLTVTGTLTKTAFNLTFNALTATTGTVVDGGVSVTGFSVTDNDPTAAITISLFSVWTANTQYGWSHTDTKTTDTITFTIGGQTGLVFNVYKDGGWFKDGAISGGNITFTMLGSDPSVLVTPSACGGNNRYWVLGTGSWSQTGHWASSSGGVEGCSAPGAGTTVFFDANSGTGTSTVDANASITALSTTGSTIGTVALGTFNLSASGNVTLVATTMTIGASAGTGLAVTGNLTLSGSAVLDGSSSASVVSVTGNVGITSATAYMKLGSGTWTFGGSWTNASTSALWSAGTGTVVFKGSAPATMTFGNLPGNEFNNVTFDSTVAAGITYTMASNGLDLVGTLLIQNSVPTPTGNLVLTTAGLAITAGMVTVAVRGTLSAGASTLTVSGNWTVTAANATFTAGTSTVVFTAAATVSMTQAFYNVTVSAGAVTAGTNLSVGNALTVSAGTLAKGTFTLSAASLTLGGGALTSTSGNVAISGPVNVASPASYIAFGSETWTVSGSWTNASTSASWAPGSGTIMFNSAAAQTMTFAGSNLSGNEFNNVTFNAGAVAVTFTMAARALRVGGTLTVGGGAAVTTLDTSASNLSITAIGLTVSGNGSLRANGSTITVTSMDTHLGAFTSGASTVVVSASGGSVNIPQALANLTVNASVSTTFVSAVTWTGALILGSATASFASDLTSSGAATLTFDSAVLNVAGNWNTSSAAAFVATNSTVSFTGAAKTVTLAAGQTFAVATVSGTYTLGSGFAANGLLTVSGTLDTTPSNFALTAAGGLTVAGAAGILRSNGSAVAVTGAVTINNASAYITSSVGGAWTVTGGSWTNASASSSWAFAAPITFRSGSSQTMSFSAVPQEFGGNVTFDSSIAAGVTYTMAANGLRVGGTLTVQNTAASPTGNTVLTTSGSSLPVAATTLTLAATGTLTANASTITVTGMDTHLGTFNVGSSAVVVNASGGAVNVPQTVNNLTVNTGVSTTFTGTLTWSGTLTLTGATVAFGSNSLVSSGAASLTFASATITMGTGTWNTSSATTISSTSSSVTFSGTGSLSIGPTAAFATVVVSGGTRTLLGQLTTNGLLTVSAGVLAKGTNPLTANAGLTLSGGALTSTSGAVSITGNVNISAAASYIAFGSEAWTVTGSWTNGSTSSSWSAGTATVSFLSTLSQTMTFAALPGGAPEFANVTFSGGSPGVTFMMAGNALAWSGILSVQSAAGITTLATSNLGLTGGSLAINNGGVLTANTSTVTVGAVTMTGGTSGTITLTTGAWTVGGNWDTSGAGSTFSPGTSTVTFSGAGTTIALAAAQSFYNAAIVGSVSLLSRLTAESTVSVANGAVLTMSGQSLSFNTLSATGSGAIADVSVNVTNLTVTNSDPTNLTTVSAFSLWAPDGEFRWTHSSTVGTSTLTFTIGGNTSGYRFNVTKDGAAFTTGIVDGSGNVVFTMLGSDPVMDVIIAVPCGSTRYWVGGAGAWSQTGHWSASSGGAGGCPAPNGASTVLFDANSGAGVVSLDQNAPMVSLDTTGFTGTLALGTYNLSVGGNLNLAGGTLTIGASSGSGLSIAGNLTLTGSAILDGSGAASLVSVAGDTSIASAAAALRMGSGTWTFSGSWSNASTSASWLAGAGTVVFSAVASHAMTFGGLAANEFYNVTFSSAAATGAIAFTMGANPLRWGGVLTIQDSSGSTTTLATGGLALSGGSIVVGDGGLLTANASAVAVADVTMTGGTSGTITVTTGAWTVTGNWDTSGAGSIFTKGSGSVTMAGAGKTLSILDATNGFNNLTISGTVTLATSIDVGAALTVTGALTTAGNGITGSSTLAISSGGALVATTSSLAFSGVTMSDATANTLSLTTGSLTVSGSWNTSGTASVFNAGASTVALIAASGTIALGSAQSFAALTLSGGYTLTTQLSAASLTIGSGGLAKGTHSLTLSGDLILSGGSLTSTSGDAAVGGSVDITASNSYIVFGAETWTVSGNWTNASTNASWSPGSGTIIFDSSTSRSMAFAGASLPGPEFYAIVFNAGSSNVTFTMAGSALQAHSLTVQGGPGTTTLDTSSGNLAIVADTVTVGAGGALLANRSTLTVRSMDTSAGMLTTGISTVVVSASGGTIRIPQALYNVTVGAGITTAFAASLTWTGALVLTGSSPTFQGNLTASGPATLTVGSATIAIAGSWDTSSASAFVSAGSSVTFTGSGETLALGGGQSFATLTITGSIAIESDVTAAVLTVATAATLTKTSHGISFNSLAVNGTVVDGSVSVTDLTVTNSDATALVTITVFATWMPGSRYGWTHSSSETSQTITWTIGGNTSGFLVQVTKNGTDFANGKVDGSGNVVFTMLGSDPDMVVAVFPPPIPPWWQSPYFLGSLPVPFLMVVAMFVQRRRWRPTKAFLVDERGQLLREFTLDSSCEVTYDQALQAGALDAVEKDVRVAKYHARAVRGDMLSLIMLAVGPANVQEVEFARGLLENIQDKLEDRTKSRVEEARNEEATLDAARAQANEERADLQARARVFGDMVNAFTIARTKLDADSQKLRKMDTNLREREQNLAEVRTSLEDQAHEIASRQVELERTASEVKSQQGDLEEAKQALRQREKEIGPKEKEIAKRIHEVSDLESELSQREAALAAEQSKLNADVEDYRTKADQVVAVQAELTEERKALDDLSGQLDEQTKALETRTSSLETRENAVAAKTEELQGKIASLEPRERTVAEQESHVNSRETAVAQREDDLGTREKDLRAQLEELQAREATLANGIRDLADERKALDNLTTEAVEERKALDTRATALTEHEAEIAKQTQDLADLKENLGPREAALFQKESDLGAREKTLADERKAFQTREDLVAAKALEIAQQTERVKEREISLNQEKLFIKEARNASSEEARQLDAKKAEFEQTFQRREADLATEEKTLGEARLSLTKDGEAFEAEKLEKSQWIASKEIELEAKEQSLSDREKEIRAQAEENAQRLSELAGREETLEIESDKLDKARAELETRKVEAGALSRDLEARTARFRDEEAQKGEELHTWQTTLESEQALLKEQRETFEKEMQEVRESWAGRMIRVEQHEEELQQRESKVQTDIEWVARNESELTTREKSATEKLKAASELQGQVERLQKELEQRAMEVESRERDLREEAAEQSVALEKRTEALQVQETDLAGQRGQWERELANQVQKMKDREAEVETRTKALDARENALASREETLVGQQAAFRQDEDRLARDKNDSLAMQKQLEGGQLELAQARERLEVETQRLTTETNAVRQSLAAKEADLTSERERLERESSALQEKLGTKAKELAAREKAVTAHEEELRAEEQDLEARLRDLESRERQAEAHTAELTARVEAIGRSEAEQKSRRAAFDQTVQKFETDAAVRQKEWRDLQATLKSQEAQLAASTENRHAEFRKRMEDLEQRERGMNASQTQAQIEKTRLEAQAKSQTEKQTELDAAAARADKRFTELKGMEEELLKTRQTFEAEKAAWANRRADELKQLEATRDAAAEQTQQSERLIEESQRRAFVAAEAEKAAKRQTEELGAAQTLQEKRRAGAEKAEKDLEVQMAQLRDASQRLGAKELELASKAKDLDSLQARLAEAEKKNAEAADALKTRKGSLDQESERIASLAAQSDKREAEIETRRTAVETKLTDVTKREQILSTELQRADNLMEDLSRKEAELQARDKGFAGREQDLTKREQMLGQRDLELRDGMQTLERLRREHEARAAQAEQDHHAAAEARKEATSVRTEADRLKTQADAMQAEVAKNMRFLQKKALDVLDREEKIRAREVKLDEQAHLLESRAQILEQKDRVFDTEKEDLSGRLEKAKQENEKLKAKLAEAEKASKSTIDMDEWKRDIENRVKIIQKKALDLLDREEKLRRKEEELRALAAQLGVEAKS